MAETMTEAGISEEHEVSKYVVGTSEGWAMKLKSLQLERFRQFSDTTFEFEDVNLLVGANNSEKTSVLYAIRAFFSLMHGHVTFEGNPTKVKFHRQEIVGTGDTTQCISA